MAKSKELKSITPDDYLAAVAQVRRSFNLRRNGPTLKQIEAQPAAKAAVPADHRNRLAPRFSCRGEVADLSLALALQIGYIF